MNPRQCSSEDDKANVLQLMFLRDRVVLVHVIWSYSHVPDSPLVSVKLFLIHFKNGKWSFCFQDLIWNCVFFKLHHFRNSSLQVPIFKWTKIFWLTALLQREGFKGITVIHRHYKSTKNCPWETCRKVPRLPQHTQLLLSARKLRFPIVRQTWTLWLLTNSTSLKLQLLE